MNRIRRGNVTVYIPDEMKYPGHLSDLMRMMDELDGFIYSVATGQTEPWPLSPNPVPNPVKG